MNRLPCLALAIALCACGGAPFTVDYASLASGDDAQTASPADAGQDSEPADPDAAWWGGVDAGEGGGDVQRSTDAADGGLGWIPSDAGEASSPDAIGPADAHADGASPSDSASLVSDGGDAGKGLCCRTEVYPGCTLAWIPVTSGKVNDSCVDPTSCVQAGSVVPCP
jgi:hypothetical protein